MKPATLKPIETYQYLDKGFVELLDVHLTDTDSALLARSSFNKEEYLDEARNRSLIRYLIRDYHSSPLEMASITVRIKMPIFVMRQHVRHRTAKLNEQSLRYVTHDGDFHLPDVIRKSTPSIKQGSLDEPVDNQDELKQQWSDHMEQSYSLYLKSLELGASKEQARGLLGTSFYTTVVWQMDVSNLLKYMTLRSDSHAQREIQELSQVFEDIISEHFPEIYAAWKCYQFDSLRLSGKEVEVISLLSEFDMASEDADVKKNRLSILHDIATDPDDDNAMSEAEFKVFTQKIVKMFGPII